MYDLCKNYKSNLYLSRTNPTTMDLIDKLKALSDRFEQMHEQIQTEEATKNAFIMPFLSALGYDVFNPLEVIPEFTADIGTKKGEKVDYCIVQDNAPAIIIECKHWREKLDVHSSQLFRYFHVVEARFAILTNGIHYRFYTDLDEQNKMDEKPFLEFSLNKISEATIHELKRFHKENFDVHAILDQASDLRYSKEIKEMLKQELHEPSEDFVRLLATRIYPGRVTAKIFEQFEQLMQRAVKQFMHEMVNDRLRTALENERAAEPVEAPSIEEETQTPAQKRGIDTTEEELQAFRIIQAMLVPQFELDTIAHRDTKSYFGILYKNNNRKPICRFWLNRSTKYLELFDTEKNSEKIVIERVEDAYEYSTRILETVQGYATQESQ